MHIPYCRRGDHRACCVSWVLLYVWGDRGRERLSLLGHTGDIIIERSDGEFCVAPTIRFVSVAERAAIDRVASLGAHYKRARRSTEVQESPRAPVATRRSSPPAQCPFPWRRSCGPSPPNRPAGP